MAKTGGLGDNLFVGGVDLSGDIGSLSRIGGQTATLDFTPINKLAFERKRGIRDGSIEFTSFFNASAGQAHPTLSALPTADVAATYCRGTGLGGISACLVGKQINYDPTRSNDGALTLVTQVQANGFGLEWARQVTAGKRTDTEATNGSSVDYGTGATTHGAQAYLQVFSFTGTDVTITVEDSADDETFAELTVFTEVTDAPTTERKAVAGTVNRYIRVATSTTSGFTNLVFAVSVKRNLVAVT